MTTGSGRADVAGGTATDRSTSGIDWTLLQSLDSMRRLQGMAADAFGLGPVETPHETVFDAPGVRLRRYAGGGSGPLIVIVPAPIKRPYIWDLAPGVSVVQRCLRAGARVFLVEWRETERDFGLAEFGDRLILDCLEAAGAEPPIVLAHSLGGLLAAIFSALHPERIRALALLAAPLHFGPDAGVFGAMVTDLETRSLPATIPGSFLSAASLRAAPETFGWERWSDWLRSLPDPAAVQNHLRVERWTLDEFALPRRLFAELADAIAREDRFVRGALTVGGRRAVPADVVAPLLCVVDAQCRIVPPESVRPFYEAVTSNDRTWLPYYGDVGVSLQHVGMLAGRGAHARLWPQIERWIAARWRGGAAQDASPTANLG